MAYITLNKAHTHHQTTINGQPASQYSRYETGIITGNKRNLPAILANSTGSDGYSFDSAVGSDDDSWHVLNAFDKHGSYVNTIAVGGAMDSDHAVVVAQTQLDSLGASSLGASSLKLIDTGLIQFDSLNRSDAGTFSIDAINKLMDNSSQDKSYLPIITASELAYETDRVTFDSVQWADNSNELLSHDGRDSTLMLDMTRADTRSDLVNEFELADVLDMLGAEPEQAFDALMDTKNRLGLLKDRLYNAMSRAGNDTVSVANVTETKPFKRQGVTNIAFVFDLSDGQKLSIWFHNPDSTPSKLMPSDIMISWKWMLNKRDVTAALSPKQGDNVQLPVLASRIMRVAAKNSTRFKRTQARQLKLEQDLLDAQALVDTKASTIEQLDKDIEGLHSRIDAAMQAPKVEPIIEPEVEPIIEPEVEPVVEPTNDTEADIALARPSQMEELKSLRNLAPKSGEAIKSDDPDAIEKLEAKLGYLQAFAAVMRAANKHVRKGDDAALSKMGLNDKEIATLKEPDYAGRTGFADYQMTNNNGEMGRVKKRLKSLYRERELELAENNDSDAPASEPLEDQLVTSVTDFAKTHAGFNGFIKNNDEAEAALAGKAIGDWVVAVNDSKYPITVFMSLDDESSYTGATNSSVESAFNDILDKSKTAAIHWGAEDAAVLPAGYDVDTASNDEIINDTRIQSLITDLGLTLTSSENNEYEYGTKTDNSAFSFKLKHGELSTVYFVQNGDGSNLNNAMTEVDDINGFVTQAKDMHAKYLALLGEDNTPDPDNTPDGPNNKKIVKGKSNKAKTPKGTKIESVFALVDAKFLIASHTANGSKNPKYPQELQPRDRARESSIAWVQKTSKELDPESLGRTGRVDTGAPIVGDDLVVESGNGRTIAIKMAYANGDASEYREWLAENADMFGMTAKQVESYKQPILVRMRTTQVNRSEFAVEANQDDKLSFTASERAKSDAKRVNAGMLELFDPSESGDILAASNRSFVKSFLASLGATEAAQYTDSNGNPTQALVARIKGALFSKAYDDDRLLEMMADQTKPELQNTLNALTMAAPKFVAAQAVNRSDAQDLAEKVVDSVEQSLSDEVKNAIVDATNMIMNAKLSNQDIKEYVLQQGLFEQVDDATAELAVFLAANARSAKKMTDYFNAMASYIEQDSVSRQTLDMFGEPEPLSLADVIAHANNQVNDNTDTIGTLDMFNETVVDDTVTDEPVEPVTNNTPLDDFNTANLAAKVDGIVAEINASDFDPEIFDIDALASIADEAKGNSDLTAKLEAASEVYQNKLIAIAMQAMSDMAGN
ncbi:hypothetical protein [Psychrobacter sp. ASPA161_6]|uniref:defense against restriction DarA-related protein n=1 Tax=Psychrobacter sp. ASPA161_6 TaxID=3160962 RepID=UPI003F81098D